MNNVSYAPAPGAAAAAQAQAQAQAPQAQAAAAAAALQQQMLQHQQQQQQQQQSVVPAFAPSNNLAFQANLPFGGGQQPQAQAAAQINVPAAAASPAVAPQAAAQRSAHSLPCTRCGYPNCDVQILGCRCLLHVRCTPVPIRACPNPRCFNSNPATAAGNTGGVGGGRGGCPLELLPMEFAELDEARRVADLAARASWRAKEKSRARKKAKLDGGGGGGGSSQGSLDEKEAEPSSTPPPPPPTSNSSDLRTGRWTSEETSYCDKLIQKFMAGRLPLPEGIKLNEFLSNMLKSKQSRLTKKMKNAKLSSKTFKRTMGHLTDVLEAREFSECEDGFFHSLQNGLERAEIRFHMQKEWRETFSTYCVSHGQPLNVDRWLASVEEMERRVHRAKDAERMQRRKMMMGCALRQDSQNPDRGVVIERAANAAAAETGKRGADEVGGAFAVPDPMVSSSPGGEMMPKSSSAASLESGAMPPSSQSMASPFLHRIMTFVHRHHVPFEYMDAWVPSFVPDADAEPVEGGDGEAQPKCRLCFAGSMVAKQVIVGDTSTPGQARRAVPLSSDDQFNLAAFGDYSESFSFDVGCGLPGRVYHMGVPTWEQSVHNAPLHHFERVGGSVQWGIRTVVGIPVPSPNVGRVVVVLYSRHDRAKDHDMVIRLTEEFSRLMPSPRWKLIVDVGQQPQQLTQGQGAIGMGQDQQQQPPPTQQTVQAGHQQQHTMQQTMQQQGPPPPQQQQPPPPQQQQPLSNQAMDIQQQLQQQQSNNNATPVAPPPPDPVTLTSEVISIFGEHMPSDPSNPAFAYLQGFMSLRLLLLRSSRSDREQDVVNTILSSYSSYKAGGRTRPDIALMLARDFMFLNQQQVQQVQHHHPMQQQHQQVQQPQMQQQQHQQPQMQQLMQQQQQQLGNGQQQYLQHSFAPAPPSQMQKQQQHAPQPQNQNGAMFSPATSSAPLPPPSSPLGSVSSGKVESNGLFRSNSTILAQQRQQQDQHPHGRQQHQQRGQTPTHQQQQVTQQYHHHQQMQQQQYLQQVDNNANIASLGDLAPAPHPLDMMATAPAPGDGEEAPPEEGQ